MNPNNIKQELYFIEKDLFYFSKSIESDNSLTSEEKQVLLKKVEGQKKRASHVRRSLSMPIILMKSLLVFIIVYGVLSVIHASVLTWGIKETAAACAVVVFLNNLFNKVRSRMM